MSLSVWWQWLNLNLRNTKSFTIHKVKMEYASFRTTTVAPANEQPQQPYKYVQITKKRRFWPWAVLRQWGRGVCSTDWAPKKRNHPSLVSSLTAGFCSHWDLRAKTDRLPLDKNKFWSRPAVKINLELLFQTDIDQEGFTFELMVRIGFLYRLYICQI